MIKKKQKNNVLTGNALAIFFAGLVVYALFLNFNQSQSQYYADASYASNDVHDAQGAAGFDAGNPDAYKMEGIIYLKAENFKAAADRFRAALKLRPTDYLLWLRLGYANYKLGNNDSAVTEYRKAIELAPHYALPKRYLGRLYLKQGNNQKGFYYLSQAAAKDVKYLPEILHLARKTYPENPEAIEKAVDPKSPAAMKAMANYFIKYDFKSDKVDKFLVSKDLSPAEKEEFVTVLIGYGEFQRAFKIWNSAAGAKQMPLGSLLNGNFESDIDPNEKSFGWVLNSKAEGVEYQVEKNKAFLGASALKIVFEGKSNPDESVLTQLVPVEPNRSYTLSFAARSNEMVSAGLPVLMVTSADLNMIVAASEQLTNKDWKTYSMSFTTSADTTAIDIVLIRQGCPGGPCPVFGQLWLDAFELK